MIQNIIGKIAALIARAFLKKQWTRFHIQLCTLQKQRSGKYDRFLPILVQQLLISGEDHRFFRHPGFDIIAICRAIWKGLLLGKKEGASTIEQQLVRVISGRYEKTFRRKVSEILLASLVKEILTKNDLPALYLKIAYFGWRMNGFEEACKRLGLSPNSISIIDAAGLIARLKYPEPHFASARRLYQINRRRDHLLRLHKKHWQQDNCKLVYQEAKNAAI